MWASGCLPMGSMPYNSNIPQRFVTTTGVDFVLLEAGDRVGGRVRTDEVDGFLLDRGFQIFLTSYPECQVSSFSFL